MRIKALLIAVAVAATTLVTGWQQAPRAWACSCVQMTLEEHADSADLVARGTVVGVDRPANPSSSLDDATYTIALTQAWKGEPAGTVEVLSAVAGASCGWEGIEQGMEIILFAKADGSAWRSNLCDGSTPTDETITAALTVYLGAPAAVDPSPPKPDTAGGPLSDPAVAGIAVLVLSAAGIGIWFARRRPEPTL